MRANALQSAAQAGLNTFIIVVPKILMFAGHGSINWPDGLIIVGGSIGGGYIGARLTMHERAKFWVFRILVVVLVLEVIHLGVQYAAPYIRPLFPHHF